MTGRGVQEATRFLVIQLRQIGDVVLTTPISRILKEARPGCRVSFLTERPSDQFLVGNPHVDEVLLNERKGSWRDTLRLARSLRRRRFDVVLDFMGNPRSALLALLSGARTRISYPVRGRGVFYTHRVKPVGDYAVHYKTSLLAPLGIASDHDRPELYLTEEERARGRAVGATLRGDGGGPLVTVDPSHRRDTRRWPAARFGALCRGLAERVGARGVVLWGPGEEAVAREVAEASGGAAVVAPRTTLREMAALIAAADLHLGTCSAPRHIAVAVGTPTFVVLGSTSSGWTHPAPIHADHALGLECQPCNRNECDRELACLAELPPERVLAALLAWAGEALGWTAGPGHPR
ncbi:MAG: glycosyltransferase family 9 protein [Deferrisomatales bacterium]